MRKFIYIFGLLFAVTAYGVSRFDEVKVSGTVTANSFVGPLTGNADTSTALAANPVDCGAGEFASSIAANGDLTCSTPSGTTYTIGTINSQASAANGASIIGSEIFMQTAGLTTPGLVSHEAQTFAGAKTFNDGVIGALIGNASTATALAANPTDCSANQFANTIAASGNLSCAQPAFTDLSGAATVAQTTVANQALTTCTTARTVDWATGNSFTLTLTDGNACTLTFSNAVSGQTITIWLTNGATGTATVVWPTAKWFPAGAPVMSTGAAALDIYTCIYNGTNYACNGLQDGG
jgi:hypothetical protein